MSYHVPMRVIPKWVLERWILVAYLIINWDLGHLREQIEIRPDKKLFDVIQNHVDAYVNEGEMPPDEIAPAILNLADDHMAGTRNELASGRLYLTAEFPTTLNT